MIEKSYNSLTANSNGSGSSIFKYSKPISITISQLNSLKISLLNSRVIKRI